MDGGQIVPSKCTFEVLSTKLEIRLVKAEAINWASLEYNQEVAVPQHMNVSLGKVHRFVFILRYANPLLSK